MKPFFFVQPDDPIVGKCGKLFEMMAAPDMHTLNLDVPPEVVDGEEVAMLQEIMMALQHYPHLIDKMLFAVKLRFTQIADSKLYFQDSDWKGDPKYWRWFHKMGSFPLVFFLLHDNEARLYTLIGDMMADERTDYKQEKGSKHGYIGLEGKQAEAMYERLHTACWMLLMFCHNCDYDPKPTIEAILAEYDLGLTYELVYKKYKEDADKGLFFRVRKKTGGPGE